jgi:hypothetical protein
MRLPAVRSLGVPLAAAALALIGAVADRTQAAAFSYPGEYRVRGRAVATVKVVHSGRRNGRYRSVGATSKDTLAVLDTGTYAYARAGSSDPFGAGTWTETAGAAFPRIDLAPDDVALDRFRTGVLASLQRARIVPRSGISAFVVSAGSHVEFETMADGRDRAVGVEEVVMSLRNGFNTEIASLRARARFRGRRIVP